MISSALDLGDLDGEAYATRPVVSAGKLELLLFLPPFSATSLLPKSKFLHTDLRSTSRHRGASTETLKDLPSQPIRNALGTLADPRPHPPKRTAPDLAAVKICAKLHRNRESRWTEELSYPNPEPCETLMQPGWPLQILDSGTGVLHRYRALLPSLES